MSETPTTHEQTPNPGLTPEEYQDALNTLYGVQGVFANYAPTLPADQSGEDSALAIDGQLVPMVDQYLFKGEQSGEKPAGRDVLAAMMMGAAQHPQDIEAMSAFLRRGGRLQQDVLDGLYRDAHNRADMRSRQPDVAREAGPKSAAAMLGDANKAVENGLHTAASTENQVMRAYAAGVYAQFPEYAQLSNDALAGLQPETQLPAPDFSVLDERLGR